MLCDLTILLTFTTTTPTGTTGTTGTNLLLGYTTLYHSTGTIYDSVHQSQITKVTQEYYADRRRAGNSPVCTSNNNGSRENVVVAEVQPQLVVESQGVMRLTRLQAQECQARPEALAPAAAGGGGVLLASVSR
jgi:hypothetical protein